MIHYLEEDEWFDIINYFEEDEESGRVDMINNLR